MVLVHVESHQCGYEQKWVGGAERRQQWSLEVWVGGGNQQWWGEMWEGHKEQLTPPELSSLPSFLLI
jgi:hypothetical protein